MIKLLLLIPTLDRSGAEKQLTTLATHLPRDEFDVRVVALTRGGPYAAELERCGVPLTVLGKRHKLDPIAWSRLRTLLHRERPDILHTWLFAANAYGRLAAGRNPPFPVIVSERCVDTWKSSWQLWLDRKLIPRTTRLIGNSQPVADFYRDLGVPAERLTVISNGLDPVPVSQSEIDAVRQELKIPSGSRVIGYVGRLAAQKRVQDLIWALELVRILDEEVQLLIVGDGPERRRLEQFARDIHVDHRIRFLGHREDVPQLLRLMDVFWLASDFEGQSNSVMEAMAARLPVVASNIPANRELVVPGETGYLVPTGDRVAFAQFAQKLLVEPELARRLGDAGCERIVTQFSTSRMVSAHAELYRAVVHERRGSSEVQSRLNSSTPAAAPEA